MYYKHKKTGQLYKPYTSEDLNKFGYAVPSGKVLLIRKEQDKMYGLVYNIINLKYIIIDINNSKYIKIGSKHIRRNTNVHTDIYKRKG